MEPPPEPGDEPPPGGGRLVGAGGLGAVGDDRYRSRSGADGQPVGARSRSHGSRRAAPSRDFGESHARPAGRTARPAPDPCDLRLRRGRVSPRVLLLDAPRRGCSRHRGVHRLRSDRGGRRRAPRRSPTALPALDPRSDRRRGRCRGTGSGAGRAGWGSVWRSSAAVGHPARPPGRDDLRALLVGRHAHHAERSLARPGHGSGLRARRAAAPARPARHRSAHRPLRSHLAVAAYMAVIPMFLGYLLFGRGLATTSASTATAVSLLEPAVATTLSVAVLHERLPVVAWSGLAAIALSLLILTLPQPRRARDPSAASGPTGANRPGEAAPAVITTDRSALGLAGSRGASASRTRPEVR